MNGERRRYRLVLLVLGTLAVVSLGGQMARAQTGNDLPPDWATYDSDGSGRLSDAECAALNDGQAADLRKWINVPNESGLFNTVEDEPARVWMEAHFEQVQYRIRENGYQTEDHKDDCGRVMDDLPMDCGGGFLGVGGAISCTVDAVGEVGDTTRENLNVVKKGFEKVAEFMADAYEELLATATTLWMDIPSSSGQSQQVIDWFQESEHMRLLTGLVAGVSFIIAAARITWSSRGNEWRGAAAGFMRLLAVSTFGIAFTQAALGAGDEWSTSLVEAATVGETSEGLKTLLARSPGLMFMLAVLGIVTSVIQIIMLVIRNAALLVLTAAWPLAAASSISGEEAMWKRTTAWIAALILYKPAAAIIYAAGFRLLHEDQAYGGELLAAIQGMVLLGLAVLALPAMIRLVVPAAGMGGPSTAGVIGAGAGVLAGGAAIYGGGLASLLGGQSAGAASTGAVSNIGTDPTGSTTPTGATAGPVGRGGTPGAPGQGGSDGPSGSSPTGGPSGAGGGGPGGPAGSPPGSSGGPGESGGDAGASGAGIPKGAGSAVSAAGMAAGAVQSTASNLADGPAGPSGAGLPGEEDR